jgi:regulatory protein YycI of two-component signal transduction system YycFG
MEQENITENRQQDEQTIISEINKDMDKEERELSFEQYLIKNEITKDEVKQLVSFLIALKEIKKEEVCFEEDLDNLFDKDTEKEGELLK